jgi:hypothetical protein
VSVPALPVTDAGYARANFRLGPRAISGYIGCCGQSFLITQFCNFMRRCPLSANFDASTGKLRQRMLRPTGRRHRVVALATRRIGFICVVTTKGAGMASQYLIERDRGTKEASQQLAVLREKWPGLSENDAKELLNIALELLVRNRTLAGIGPIEDSLRNFLAAHGLSRKRVAIFEALASTASARLRQYGETINQIFSTNSFDIYRALGRRTDVSIILDASVAMPVLFGLSFGTAKSRYGVAAVALKTACEAHDIKMVVPRAYLNEMASHGMGALDKLEVYEALPA